MNHQSTELLPEQEIVMTEREAQRFANCSINRAEKARNLTWTYGASEGRTIFINDNTLPNPKERGIAAIVCHQIGREEAERLAKLFIASEDLLKACKRLAEIVRVNFSFDGQSWKGIKGYQSEVDQARAAIALAEGKEANR